MGTNISSRRPDPATTSLHVATSSATMASAAVGNPSARRARPSASSVGDEQQGQVVEGGVVARRP